MKFIAIFKEKEEIHRDKGNLTDWEIYHETNLAPVTLRFAVNWIFSKSIR